MVDFITPFKRLKWGILPVRRIVDEGDGEEHLQESNFEEEGTAKEDEKYLSVPIEYRDEANRPWWKFFDEYEYRQNKYVRGAHKVWKWFDENDSPAERKIMWKLDILLTFYSFMAYWVKYLDQVNLNNAYINTGFTTDLGMKGNDLVNTQVLFNVGNIVFCIPFIYILYACPLSYVLPLLDLCWSLCTIGVSQINSVWQLKVLRFFIGSFEAPSYLAYQYLFGTFIYNPAMIARRSMIYYMGQYLGIMTSGLLSGAIVEHLDGVMGYHAWRWIFIIDGCISLGIGILGLYMIPGTPSDMYSIFFSDDEIRLLRRKLKENHVAGRPDPKQAIKNIFSYEMWKSILISWEFWVLTAYNFFLWNGQFTSSGAYNLWLKSLNRYNQGLIQFKTALPPGLGFVWLFIVSMFADLFHCRYGAVIFSQLMNMSGSIILAVWNVSDTAKWYAFCVSYFAWAGAPTVYSWQNDICRRDAQKRAVVLVWMNMFAQAGTAWSSVIVWKTVEAPRYLKGYSWAAANAFALIIGSFVVLALYKWNEKKHARQNGIVLYNSKTGPIPDEAAVHDKDSLSSSSSPSTSAEKQKGIISVTGA